MELFLKNSKKKKKKKLRLVSDDEDASDDEDEKNDSEKEEDVVQEFKIEKILDYDENMKYYFRFTFMCVFCFLW